MEINIGRPPLRSTLGVKLWRWFKYSYGDFTTIDRAFLFRDAENIRAGSSAIGNGITGRVLAKLFDRYLMCMQSPGIECIIVCDVDWVIPREQLRGDAVVKWLGDDRVLKLVQSRVAGCYSLRGHVRD
jgi:hypothetical protein